MVTMANELVAMARFFTEGIPVNRETLALEAVKRVKDAGPKGMFLTDDHTFDHFEDALFIPKLLDRSRYDSWEADGSKDLYHRARQETKKILEEHRMKPKDDQVLQKIEALVNSLA